MSKLALLVLLPGLLAAQQAKTYGFGKPATADQIAAMNITVMPDGTGLPPGSGTAAKGEKIFEVRCVLCHGNKGAGKEGRYPALVGGQGTLNTKKPKKTVGSYWPYATTIWDFIHRAMPFNQPGSLPPNDVYSLTAYILSLNGIIPENMELNAQTLPQVKMPNRDGFVWAKH